LTNADPKLSVVNHRMIKLRDNRPTLLIAGLLMTLAAGCESMPGEGPAPAGPGVAASADLRPWLAHATNDTRSGQLQFVNIPSTQGSYYTWSLAPADPAQAVEVDIRPCGQQAEALDGRVVTITGKLIDRGNHHLPLLIAEQIRADGTEDPAAIEAADASNPFTHEFDPATDQVQTACSFHAETFLAASE
jgi:hypothetical protein